jgi:hypothetical protein
MISAKDLQDAIDECERSQPSYNNCEKLATFYTIHDHLYQEAKPKAEAEQVVGAYGDSEFLTAVTGKSAEQVWEVLDELAEVLKAINPNLYNGIIRKMAEL